MIDHLNSSDNLYKQLFNHILSGYAYYDIIKVGQKHDYLFLEANPAFKLIFGLENQILIGKTFNSVLPGIEPYWHFNFEKTINTKEITTFENYCHSLKKYFKVTCYMPELNKLAVLISDISEEKLRQLEIEFLSYHDSLTGLYNRTYLDRYITSIENKDSYMESISVIIGDINGLKIANDVFGHKAGDELIKIISNIILDSCSDDNLVARMGGDEFVILMPETDYDTALSVCDKIYKKCSSTIIDSIGGLSPSISLGCTATTDLSQSMSSIMSKAEKYMYKRKLLDSRSMHSSYLKTIKKTLDEKSHETQEHAVRLKSLCVKVAEELNLPEHEVHDLELFCMLHDVGKVAIEDKILNKPGPLNDSEYFEIKKHTEIGYRITQSSAEISHLANLVLTHHERWDGKGYPLGLKSCEIPLLSRILSIVDSFDAMTQDRPYRKAISIRDAKEELLNNSGTQFDPELVDTFIRVTADIWE